MSETEPTPASSTSGKSGWVKKTSLGCLGLFVVLILIALIFSDKKTAKRIEQTTTTEAATTSPSQSSSASSSSKSSAPAPASGTGVSRHRIQNVFEARELGYTFKESTPVDGVGRYMGTSSKINSIIELYEPWDNVSKASITAIFGSSSEGDANLVAGLSLVALANIYDKSAGRWVTDQFGKAAKAENTYEESTVIGGNRFEISFHRSSVMSTMTVEVTPE